jgi:hypothetical protein
MKRKAPSELPEGMQPHRFMRHMDPPLHFDHNLAEALRSYRDSVPDILLVEYDNHKFGWNFTIVELKYCRDTDPEPQQERAATQHSALKQLIHAHDPNASVNTVTLMLGASGIIYESFMQNMRLLGVDGSALKSLARRLHFIAVRNLKSIWAQRSAIVQGQNKGPGRKGKRNKGKKPQPKRWKPAHKAPGGQAPKGTKRLRAQLEPDHRKRRKKR